MLTFPYAIVRFGNGFCFTLYTYTIYIFFTCVACCMQQYNTLLAYVRRMCWVQGWWMILMVVSKYMNRIGTESYTTRADTDMCVALPLHIHTVYSLFLSSAYPFIFLCPFETKMTETFYFCCLPILPTRSFYVRALLLLCSRW